MRAKDVEFDVTYINLREKPDWFLRISPHGKVPVLVVEGENLFESNAIAEYLDEVVAPRLHPENPIERARNRAWTDYVPTFAAAISSITYAKTAQAVANAVQAAAIPMKRVEDALSVARLSNDGPYFNGPVISLVDAAYAPFLQRLALVEPHLKTGLLTAYPNLKAWSDLLLADPRVVEALAPEFPAEFRANHKRRETYAWQLMQQSAPL